MEIYIDSSVDAKRGKSVGCYKLVGESGRELIRTVNLESIESTAAELELALRVLSALYEEAGWNEGVTLYTDCTNLANLKTRRYSVYHHNAALYNRLRKLLIDHDVVVVKAKGHTKRTKLIFSQQKHFAEVDRGARKALRALA